MEEIKELIYLLPIRTIGLIISIIIIPLVYLLSSKFPNSRRPLIIFGSLLLCVGFLGFFFMDSMKANAILMIASVIVLIPLTIERGWRSSIRR